jgi:RNA 2',3'-cyclic 3'-phosphodiesterase
MPRLFFALRPGAEQGAALLAEFEARFAGHGIAVIPVGNLHATLCFLGAVEAARVPALSEAASRVHMRKVSLRFDALEHWVKPRIICATASPSGVVGADTLARAISDEVIAAGFSPDIKPFRAHLTLARKVRAAQAEALALPQSLQPGFVVRCEEFVLMQSRRGERGSIYSVVESWLLDG